MIRRFWQKWRHPWGWLSLAIATLGVILLSAQAWLPLPAIATRSLPPLQPHPLPLQLSQWQDPAQNGDYFDQVQPTPAGYLVWSRFPISVYVEPPPVGEKTPPALASRATAWLDAVDQAIQEWTAYLPLAVVEQADLADITIWRSPPPIRLRPQAADPAATNREPGTDRLANRWERIRSAETRYEFYVRSVPDAPSTLSHRCKIYLSPNQTPSYVQAAARHELGHALGIWGHSPAPTDALYFSQVRNPPGISPRDVNTLKRVYEQETRLGWVIPN